MAKASLDPLFFKQDIDAVCKTYQSIHTGETVSVNESFFCKEVVLEESTLLYFEFDSGIHITCHNIQYVRKFSFLEVLNIFCSLGNISKHQTAEGVSAAAQQKSVVAAGNDIILAQLTLETFYDLQSSVLRCALHSRWLSAQSHPE